MGRDRKASLDTDQPKEEVGRGFHSTFLDRTPSFIARFCSGWIHRGPGSQPNQPLLYPLIIHKVWKMAGGGAGHVSTVSAR